ncbi:phenylacetate-CoA ligase [Desulfohalotomaculum tongense]|uniref:phenylacetate--CoA ligase family protein n=1 Tax=Desulforadius tongensis TaxID=1216062 RepID=UPI0019588AD7|nr:phenylacetate--CoA ligase [Desulforadius tongensis]MBM7855352.1 phenylacetate-CoA ligase [Desulforadius tongensis]
MYWQREYETMSREQIRKVQLERLQALVKRLYNEVPFYQQRFKEKGLLPGDIKTLEDIKHLPFTTKQDLRDTYPFGMFAVPMEDVVRLHGSSGTTGKPVVVGYTKNDLRIWGNLIARSMVMAGVTKNDVVQNAYGYGLFTGGMGIHYGAETLGAAVVPMSGGNTAKQLMLMQDFGTTVLTCTPTYALYMAEEAHAGGVDWEKIKLKIGIFGAEPWSNEMRRQLEESWNITAVDIYGLSEVLGPGVACECRYKKGLHINEDHFIAEVIDPETGEPLPYGQRGELVFTSLTKEAFPVLRYRTRDISVLYADKCECGRTLIRMERVTGRTDDMLIIRGVNVFPSQVESVLLEFGETEPHYLLVVDKKGTMDDLEIWVEVSDRMFSDKVRGLEDLEKRLRARVLSVLGISAKIRLVEPKSIPRSEGKAKRIIDKRPK